MKYSQQEVDMFEMGNGPIIQNVKVGDKIKTPDEDDESQMVTWKVKEVHPHLVYAISGSRHRCFNYGMLVQLGLESQFTPNYREGNNSILEVE